MNRDPIAAVFTNLTAAEWAVMGASVTVAAVLILGSLGRFAFLTARDVRDATVPASYPPPVPPPTQRDIDQTWLLAWAADDDIDARFNEIVERIR